MDSYQKKIDFAIKLLKAIPEISEDNPVEVCYSTGKDSDVILQLAKEAGIPFRAIYKNTTIDCVGSISHAKKMGVEIIRPKQTFFELIRDKGYPTRWYRFCCSILKEYKILDRQIVGIRRCESRKRMERYKEPEVCRTYSKTEKVKQYLPILDWTDEDVERFIQERGIKCHHHYYDEQGKFHIERRVGCMGCPLQSIKKRREEFLKYPKMLKLWIASHLKFMEKHPDSKSAINFNGDSYAQMFYNLFCDTNLTEYQSLIGGGIFPELKIDCKAFLEDYFKIDLTI